MLSPFPRITRLDCDVLDPGFQTLSSLTWDEITDWNNQIYLLTLRLMSCINKCEAHVKYTQQGTCNRICRTDATCNVQQLLGVFDQQCCVRFHGALGKQCWELLRPFARSLKVNIIYQWRSFIEEDCLDSLNKYWNSKYNNYTFFLVTL